MAVVQLTARDVPKADRPSSALSTPVVVVIDDEESVRKSLVRLIQAGGYTAEAFACAEQFLASPVPEDVSCVVTDLSMPGITGLRFQELLRSKVPFLSIVFVSGRGDIPASVNAMKAGAIDFLEKPIKGSTLLKAIASGVERTENAKRAEAEYRQLSRQYQDLTPREREVFVLVSAGLLNKQVAAQLGAAEKTVKQHRGNVMRKMRADSLAELVVKADRMGVRPTNSNFAEARGRVRISPVR